MIVSACTSMCGGWEEGGVTQVLRERVVPERGKSSLIWTDGEGERCVGGGGGGSNLERRRVSVQL